MESKFDRLGASDAGAGVAAGGAGGAENPELGLGSSRFGGDGLYGMRFASEDTGAGVRLLNLGESTLLRAEPEDEKNPLGGDAGRVSPIGLRSCGALIGWVDGECCA